MLKKKSPAQLDREIAEALSQEPGMTTEQIERYRSGRKWGWPADLAFKAATGRPLSRTPGRRSHATKSRSTWPSVIGSHDLGTADVRTADGAYWIVTVPTGYRVDYKPWGPSSEIDLGTVRSRQQARAKITKHAGGAGAIRSHATIATQIGTVNEFWDLYEAELVKSILEAPEKYALRSGESAGDYARRIRESFQQTAESSGLGQINLDSNTFKRVARRLGIAKFSQKALKTAYLGLAR